MDRGKRPTKIIGGEKNSIYMDLKDIVREHALHFLPAKSLFRFTGVCSDWKLRISSPFFAHNQSHFFRAVSGFFSQDPGNPPSFISLNPKSYGVPDPSLQFLPVPVDIKASCNGMLCCQGRTEGKAYYICNPVSKQWKALPNPNSDHGPHSALVLVFEPSPLNFAADYKLVCAFPSSDFDDGYEFEIYSSSTGSWTLSGEILFGRRKLVPWSGVHVNGTVYWQSISDIVAFDLNKDRSRLIQSFGFNGCLGEMNGRLCHAFANNLSVRVSTLSNIYSNTMEMGSSSPMWSEKHCATLEISEIGGKFPSQMPVILYVGNDVVVVRVEETVFSYDMNTKKTTVLCRSANDGTRYVSYVNGLVSVAS